MSKLWLLGIVAGVLILGPVLAYGQDAPPAAPPPKHDHGMKGGPGGDFKRPEVQLTDDQKGKVEAAAAAFQQAVAALKDQIAATLKKDDGSVDENAVRQVLMQTIMKTMRALNPGGPGGPGDHKRPEGKGHGAPEGAPAPK